MFVRAFAKDGSSKSILVDEKMSIGQVCSILADKNHVRLNAKLAVIEHMPDLYMGKNYKLELYIGLLQRPTIFADE